MLWSGAVLDPKTDDDRALAELNDALASDDRVENVLLTVRDGVQLVVKK
jgi:predicted O-methyltransferase YrrM